MTGSTIHELIDSFLPDLPTGHWRAGGLEGWSLLVGLSEVKVPANTGAFLSLGAARGGGQSVGKTGGEISPSPVQSRVAAREGREHRMGERQSDSDCPTPAPITDFDSLFVIGEADQSVLVAKQQQQVNFVSRHHHGSGYNSPNRGSPARRTQVTSSQPECSTLIGPVPS